MPEMGTSGLMSGDGKRGGAPRQCSRPSSTLPTPAPIYDTVWMPSVARSGDAARTSAYATVAAAKLCEICGLVDEKSGLAASGTMHAHLRQPLSGA